MRDAIEAKLTAALPGVPILDDGMADRTTTKPFIILKLTAADAGENWETAPGMGPSATGVEVRPYLPREQFENVDAYVATIVAALDEVRLDQGGVPFLSHYVDTDDDFTDEDWDAITKSVRFTVVSLAWIESTHLAIAGLRTWLHTLVPEIQVVAISGSPSGGTFRLTFRGQQTSALARAATAAAIQTALNLLSTIGAGGVEVSGADGGPWAIEFSGLHEDVPLLTAQSSLTGGTAPAITVTQTDGYLAPPTWLPSNTLPGVFWRWAELPMVSGPLTLEADWLRGVVAGHVIAPSASVREAATAEIAAALGAAEDVAVTVDSASSWMPVRVLTANPSADPYRDGQLRVEVRYAQVDAGAGDTGEPFGTVYLAGPPALEVVAA